MTLERAIQIARQEIYENNGLMTLNGTTYGQDQQKAEAYNTLALWHKEISELDSENNLPKET